MRGRVRIDDVDVRDDDALRAMHDLHVASEEREYGVAWSWLEFVVTARTDDPWVAYERLLVRDESGRPVAAGVLELPQRDNTHLGWADVWVLPDGFGTDAPGALVEELKDRVRRAGRRTVHSGACWPLDEPTSLERDLLERSGLSLGLVEAHRVLDLPVQTDRLERLASEAAEHHGDYDLVAWRGPCPAAWVDAYADLRARMLVEAPSGDMEVEAEDFDADRVRHEEAQLAAQRRTSFTTVAVQSDGSVAGHTQLVMTDTDSRNAYQWDTLVLPEHRGHRLGLALKVRNHTQATDAIADRSLVHTWNAVDNAPMIEVNDRMGFRLVEYAGEFQCSV